MPEFNNVLASVMNGTYKSLTVLKNLGSKINFMSIVCIITKVSTKYCSHINRFKKNDSLVDGTFVCKLFLCLSTYDIRYLKEN